MHTPLFVFEFLGTTELLVIALVALILFGPRKLPEIGRTVGKGLAEFRRASDDFKRTWEYEVELERRKETAEAGADSAPAAEAVDDASPPPPAGEGFEGPAGGEARPREGGETVARTPPSRRPEGAAADFADEVNAS